MAPELVAVRPPESGVAPFEWLRNMLVPVVYENAGSGRRAEVLQTEIKSLTTGRTYRLSELNTRASYFTKVTRAGLPVFATPDVKSDLLHRVQKSVISYLDIVAQNVDKSPLGQSVGDHLRQAKNNNMLTVFIAPWSRSAFHFTDRVGQMAAGGFVSLNSAHYIDQLVLTHELIHFTDFYLAGMSPEYTRQRDLACIQFVAKQKLTNDSLAYMRNPTEIIAVGAEMFYNVRLDDSHRYPNTQLDRAGFAQRFPLLSKFFVRYYGNLESRFAYREGHLRPAPVKHPIVGQHATETQPSAVTQKSRLNPVLWAFSNKDDSYRTAFKETLNAMQRGELQDTEMNLNTRRYLGRLAFKKPSFFASALSLAASYLVYRAYSSPLDSLQKLRHTAEADYKDLQQTALSLGYTVKVPSFETFLTMLRQRIDALQALNGADPVFIAATSPLTISTLSQLWDDQRRALAKGVQQRAYIDQLEKRTRANN